MAVDETLLDTAARDSIATFRWYRWSEPTLSLGYFQKLDEAAADSRWRNIPKIRRLSGGGAILHHHEWTYSFAVPARQTLFRNPEELYDIVHQAIIGLLNRLGGDAGLRGETRLLRHEPWLCFSRQDAHDVIWRGRKILGSAQRRRKGAILQHGSLLERASPYAPGHPGVIDLGLSGPLSLHDLQTITTDFVNHVELNNLTISEVTAVQMRIAREESTVR